MTNSTYLNNLSEKFKRQLPCFGKYDIIVVGGGPAGIAAAVTSAECGHKVLMIERLGFCGGAAVAGMSGTICGLYMTVEEPQISKPNQIIFGFAERFRSLLYDQGGLTDPQIYGKTWVVTHDCATYKRTSTDLLRNANVNVLFHTQMIDVIAESGQAQGLVLHTKQGFTTVLAKRIIDCSGDADVIHRLGLKTTKGNNGVIQNPTMIFKVGNVDMPKFSEYWGQDTISPPKVVDMLMAEKQLIRKKVWLFPTVNPNEILVNATKITGFDHRDLDVTNPVDHSEAEQFSMYQAHAFFEFMQKNIPGCEKSYFIDYAPQVGVRQTRSIDGVKRLTNEDVVEKRKHADAIARSSWPIELHYGAKPITEWLIEDYYDVPFHTLVPKNNCNVIVAGRCLSSEHEALASCRVTAQCFEYGRAAALATDISITECIPYQQLDGQSVADLVKAKER